MGNVPQEDTARNEALAQDYKLYLEGKMTMLELREKYPISESRIRELGKKWVVKLGLK